MSRVLEQNWKHKCNQARIQVGGQGAWAPPGSCLDTISLILGPQFTSKITPF